MTVLLLKSISADDGDQSEWRSLADDVRTVSPLGFEFINGEELKQKLANPSSYAGIVCTSQRTVTAVHKWCPLPDTWIKAKPCYVVGPGTATKVKELLHWTPELVVGENSGSAEQLVQILPTEDLPLLYPCGQKETMSKHIDFTRIDKITSYQTCKSQELDSEIASMPSTDLSAVVFFSPSGVKYSLQILLRTKKIDNIVAIGPTTYRAIEKALKEEGNDQVAFYQAEKPSPEGVRRVLDSIKTI